MKANEKTALFRKPVNLVVVLFPLFFFNSVIFKKCKCKKKPAPIEIISKVTAIHGIAIFDVNSVPIQNIHNVKVTLIDPEKMVLSSNGFPFESVRLSGGIMSIGLSPRAQYSAERPYRFTIRAEADGYMTNTRSIVITSGSPNYFPIFLAKLNNSGLPPSGLAAAAGELTSVSGGVITRDEVLMTANRTVDSLIIRIPNGTRLFNGDKPVTEAGPLSYRLLTGMARDSFANRVFPGGFEITDAIDQTGQKIASATDPAFFTTAGWFSLEMNIGNTEVNRFSNPLNVVIPVSDSVINPATQEVIKTGDKIPIWSMNKAGTWRLESEAEIISSGSGLRANIRINHLSPFNLDYKGPRCPPATMMAVNYDAGVFPSSGMYYSEYIDENNAILKQGLSDYTTTAGSKQIINAPNTGSGRLFVHNGASQTDGGLAVSDPPLSCSGTTSAQLNPLGETPSSLCTTIRLLREGTANNLCPNNVWIQNTSGIEYFALVGILNAGEINIPVATGFVSIALYYGTTGGGSVLMTITISTIEATSGSAQITVGAATPQSVTYSRDGSGPCNGTVTITLPSGLIGGINCSS